mgnify:CR=1 FL=1
MGTGILEKQFRIYVEKALKSKGNTGEALLILLEKRLDNVVYKLGFAESRPMARQTISTPPTYLTTQSSMWP